MMDYYVSMVNQKHQRDPMHFTQRWLCTGLVSLKSAHQGGYILRSGNMPIESKNHVSVKNGELRSL